MLAALLERRPVEEPVALVVAHPDDETLAAGGSLHLFRRLLLIHVTDGAPRALGDAAREGFDNPAAYAAARARELDAALAHSAASPERVSLGITDQEATAAVPAIAARLHTLFVAREIGAVLTHGYEGGHPDHDAVAMAVHSTRAEVFEFAGYHADGAGHLQTGAFLKASPAGKGLGKGSRREPEEAVVVLDGEDLARKQAMLACFWTQREIISRFDPTRERFRRAPPYDFSEPPHPGQLLYEEWGWMTGETWREQVRCGG